MVVQNSELLLQIRKLSVARWTFPALVLASSRKCLSLFSAKVIMNCQSFKISTGIRKFNNTACTIKLFRKSVYYFNFPKDKNYFTVELLTFILKVLDFESKVEFTALK